MVVTLTKLFSEL